MICEFGEVVVVPFPFVDRPISKRRPALVLSREKFNGENGHSVLAMITTGARSAWPSDVELIDGKTAGLDHRSVVRWKLFTLPNEMILRRIGSLGGKDKRSVSLAARSALAS